MSGSAKERWGEFTGDDVAQAQGDREPREGKIQQRYCKTKDEVRREVDEWSAGH